MALILYELADFGNGVSLLRDSRDRVFIGPLTPPHAEGRAYYLNVATSQKMTASLAIEVVPLAKPEVDDGGDVEAAALCPVCNTPLTAKQVKRGGKYCSATCRNKAARERASQ